MRYTKTQQITYFYETMNRMGFDFETANKLRLIEKTLHRWSEAECNGEIQREGENGDGRPRRYYGQFMDHSYPVADREAGAIKRLAAIMTAHPDFVSYVQGDPRDCALYLIPKDKINAGDDIGSIYNRGFGVCY